MLASLARSIRQARNGRRIDLNQRPKRIAADTLYHRACSMAVATAGLAR
jgi:hypothetical protein